MTDRDLPFDKEPPKPAGLLHIQAGEDGAFVLRAGDRTTTAASGDINFDCVCGTRLVAIAARGDKGAAIQFTHQLAAMILLCRCGLTFEVRRKLNELHALAQKKKEDKPE